MSITKAYNIHKQLGAKFIEFAGSILPVSYKNTILIGNNDDCNKYKHKGGIINETINTRDQNKCSVFDVSHMGQYKVYGTQRKKFLDCLVASDIINLDNNKSILTVFTNHQGGIMDDVIITNQDDHINIVCNGANKSKIQNYLETNKKYDIDINYNNNTQLYAIQGPQSLNVLATVLKKYNVDDTIIKNLGKTQFMSYIPVIIDNHLCDVYNQGYTGELGFEISIPDEIAESFFYNILKHDNAHVAGLGSRDILRLESGYCLYGQDIDENTNVLEARLGWILGNNENNVNGLCKRQRRNFPGADLILNKNGNIKQDYFNKIRTGFISDKRYVTPQKNDLILSNYEFEKDKEIGYITSGCFSPHLNKNIAMGYIHTDVNYTDSEGILIKYNKNNTPVNIKKKNKLNSYKTTNFPIYKS